MNIFKVVLSTVGGEKEKILYMLPPAKMTDEETGLPVFDEEELAATQEYKEFVKATKANVIDISYTLFNAPDNTTKDYDELRAEEQYFEIIDKNDYIIEAKSLKAAKPSGKKTSKALYVVIALIAVAVFGLLIYDSVVPKAKQTDETETVASETTTELTEADITTTASEEITTGTTDAASEVTTSAPVITTGIIKFDKNSGIGALAEQKEYKVGAAVDLPFTELSKVGYNLIGWATAPQEPYTLYDNGLNRLTMGAENITLYAIWSAAEYDVVYNYDINGTAATSIEKAVYGSAIKFMQLNGVASSRGIFQGWNIDPNATEALKSCTMPAKELNLYAIYKKP